MVDDFGDKYLGKEHALHLKVALKIYRVATYWEGKLYIGITLKRGYEKGTGQLPMTGYVLSALHNFQHKKT